MLDKLLKLIKIFEKKDQKKLALLFLMSIIAMVLEVSSIVAILPLIRKFLSPNQNFELLNNLSIFQLYDFFYIVIFLFVSVHLIKFLFLSYFYFYKNNFINSLSARLTSRLFSNYLFKNYEFHTKKKTSVMVRNLITEVKLLCSTFINPVFVLIVEIFIILGILIFLFIYDRSISLFVGVSFLFLIIAYSLAVKKKFLNWGKQRQDLNNKSLKLCLDGLSGIKDIMIYHKQNFFRKKFEAIESEFSKISTLYGTFQQLPRLFFEFIVVFFLLFLLIILKMQGLSIATIIEIVAVFGLASVRFIPSASKILGSIQQLRFGIPALNIIINENISSSKYYDNLSKDREKNFGYKFKDNINFKNIHFSYGGSQQNKIFDNINIEIKKKEIIGLFGPSGSGKSTFADLLCGLLLPTSGSIYLDGKNIMDNHYILNTICAYVPQSVYLLNDSIENNITFGEQADKIKLDKAIHIAQLSSFVEKASNGMETIVGERGTKLSGGQIQRIGIARAIYHESEVLIFDESTNALDLKSENKVIEEIKNLKNLKTIIVISHKLSNLSICDRVYELKDKKLELKNIN
jgi:ABC-type multidrug transport system fused ATPase/permease subunit